MKKLNDKESDSFINTSSAKRSTRFAFEAIIPVSSSEKNWKKVAWYIKRHVPELMDCRKRIQMGLNNTGKNRPISQHEGSIDGGIKAFSATR